MDSSDEPVQKRLKVENGHSAARNGEEHNMMVFPRDDVLGEHDVTLIVDQKSYRCHKRILSQHSKYFNSMFTLPMQESKAGEVILQDVSREAADVLFSYIYSKENVLNVDAYNMAEVTAMATMLQMDSAVDLCISLMLENLGPENCLGFMQVAQENFLPIVYRKSRVCAVSNFSTVVESTELCQLSVAQLKDYLSDEYLNTSSELEVFDAVMAWHRGGESSDEETEDEETEDEETEDEETEDEKTDLSVDLPDLMDTCLFLGDLDLASVEDMLGDKTVQKCAPLKSYFENLKKIKMHNNQDGTAKKERHRKKAWRILCVGSPEEEKADRDSMDPDLQRERTPRSQYLYSCEEESLGDRLEFHMKNPSEIPFPTSSEMGFHVCASDLKVFVSGGELVLGRNTWNYGVWQLDTTTLQWSKIGDLRQPRRHHASCCYKDKLLMVGGFGRYRTIQNSVEHLDLGTGKWKHMAPLRYAEFTPTVVLMGDRMLIFKSHVQLYDLVSEECTVVAWDQQAFPLCRMLAFPSTEEKILYVCLMESGKVFRLTMGDGFQVEEVGDLKGSVNTCAQTGRELVCFQTDENKRSVSIFHQDKCSIQTWGLKGATVTLSSLAVAVPKYPDYQL